MDINRVWNTFGDLDNTGSVVNDKHNATRIKSRPHQDSWTFWLLIMLFKIFGLATFTRCLNDQKKKNSQKSFTFQYSQLGIVYNVLLVCLILSSNCLSISYSVTSKNFNKSFMGIGLKIFRKVLSSISINTVLLSYCYKEKALVRIGNQLLDIEHELDRVYRLYPSLRRQRVFRLLTVVCIFNGSTGLCLLLTECLFFNTKLSSWLSDIVPILHLGWFMIQYFISATILEADFADLNHAIQCFSRINTPDLQSQSLYQTRRLVIGNSTVQQLLELRDVHSRLCDVSQDVSDFYSVSILFVISYIFISLVYSSYYILSPLLANNDILLHEILIDIVWLIVPTYPLFLLTGSITKLLNEMARTNQAITNLMTCLIDKEARLELQQISLQLLHRKVYFTACGYFALDNALFHSIISAVTTYLVILAQFQISNGSSSESPCNSTQHETPNSTNNEITNNKCNKVL